MPSLNEFHESYREKGVKLLALSNEGESVVGRFVEEQGLHYPVGVDPGGKTGRAYGVSGFPTAFVIDAGGEIVWRGHPGDHEALVQAVDAALQWANVVPAPAQPHARLDKVTEMLEEGELGGACKALAALRGSTDAGLEKQAGELTRALDELVKQRLEQVEAKTQEGAYHDAARYLERLAAAFEGCDHHEKIEDVLGRIEKTPEAKEDLAAGRLFEKAVKYAGSGDLDKVAKGLQSLVKKYPQTATAAKAERILQEL